MRDTWGDYFLGIMKLVAQRSTCIRRRTGAIAVRNKRVVATGYNGAPPGMQHCTDIGTCLRDELKIPSGEKHELCRAVHAEENLIIQAAYEGLSLKGCDIYVTHKPCSICIKKIISLYPKNLFYLNDYNDDKSQEYIEHYFKYKTELSNGLHHYEKKVWI